MIERLPQLFHRHTFVRYLSVGGAAYACELGALLALYQLTGSRTFAAAVSYLLGFVIAFALQKLIAFREFSRELKAISRQGALYIALNIWNYVFTVVFVSVLPGRYLIITRTAALALMSCWNYVIYRKIIFRHIP